MVLAKSKVNSFSTAYQVDETQGRAEDQAGSAKSVRVTIAYDGLPASLVTTSLFWCKICLDLHWHGMSLQHPWTSARATSTE